MQQNHNTECVHLDIAILPTHLPPPPPSKPTIPEKLLKIMQKYQYNWRIDQLSQPRVKTKKYVPKEISFIKGEKTQPPKLSDEIKFFADQMSRPKLKDLYMNKRTFENQGKLYRRKISKNIAKAWGSIYNFYKKKERDRRLRQLRQQQKVKGKKSAPDLKRYDELAKPKPVFQPEPLKEKPSKIFSNFDRLDELASPKPYVLDPPKSLEVNPAALTYEPTEVVLRLAKLPERFLNLPKPLEPGKVKRSALRYKITPRIDQIALPKQRGEKSKVDEDFDPWAISKNALTYKATPRILELAKPTERD